MVSGYIYIYIYIYIYGHQIENPNKGRFLSIQVGFMTSALHSPRDPPKPAVEDPHKNTNITCIQREILTLKLRYIPELGG